MSGPPGQRREAILRGEIFPTLLRLSWPLIVGNQLSFLILIMSSFWMGRLVGTPGLTVMAIVGPPELVVGWMLGAVASGHGTLIAQSVGAGDGQGMRMLASTTVLQLLFCGLLSAAGLLLLGPIAHQLAGSSPALAPLLRSYLVPFLLSVPLIGLTEVLIDTGTATGWAKFGLARTLADLAFMAALTPLFIQLCHLGVAGPPTAVAVGALALVATMWWTLNRRRNELGLGDRAGGAKLLDGAHWRQVAGIGGPVQIGRVAGFVAQTMLVHLVTRGGDRTTAGYGLCMQLLFLPPMFTAGIARANAILIAQNLGARQPARSLSSLRMALPCTAAVAVLCFLLVPLARPLCALFTDDPAVVDEAMRAMHLLRWGYLLIPIWQVLINSYAATGATKLIGAAMTGSQVVGVVVAYRLNAAPMVAAATGFAICQGLTVVAALVLYRQSFHRRLFPSPATAAA